MFSIYLLRSTWHRICCWLSSGQIQSPERTFLLACVRSGGGDFCRDVFFFPTSWPKGQLNEVRSEREIGGEMEAFCVLLIWGNGLILLSFWFWALFWSADGLCRGVLVCSDGSSEQSLNTRAQCFYNIHWRDDLRVLFPCIRLQRNSNSQVVFSLLERDSCDLWCGRASAKHLALWINLDHLYNTSNTNTNTSDSVEKQLWGSPKLRSSLHHLHLRLFRISKD